MDLCLQALDEQIMGKISYGKYPVNNLQFDCNYSLPLTVEGQSQADGYCREVKRQPRTTIAISLADIRYNVGYVCF